VQWDWLGEPLAVDFANTVKRHGASHVELLASGEDLLAWCGHETERVPAPGASEAQVRLDEVRAVRDDVFAVLLAATAGEPPPSAAAERLNARMLRHPVVRQLGAPARPAVSLDATDELLARVAAATADVVGDDALAYCDAPSCGQFFMRPRAGQRWCSDACGTRARVARHAARHRD